MSQRHQSDNQEGSSSAYQTMELPSQQEECEPDGIVNSSPAEGESHTRSILKGITWRAVATGTTVTIAWIVIGEVSTAFQIGFFEVFAKIAIYYIHERIWAKIPV